MNNETNESLIKKARRAVWLNRCLGIAIPYEYHKFVISLECCSKKFLETFLKNPLAPLHEVLLVETHAQNNPDLVVKYISEFGICTEGEIKAIETKNFHIIEAMFDYYRNHKNTHFLSKAQVAIVDMDDFEFTEKIFKRVPFPICNDVCLRVVEKQDPKLLMFFASLRSLNSVLETQLIKKGSPEMVRTFLSKRLFSDDSLLRIVKGDLPCSVPTDEILRYHIENSPLSRDILLELVSQDDKELLKLYFIKHGLPSDVLAYYSHRHHFMQDTGLL